MNILMENDRAEKNPIEISLTKTNNFVRKKVWNVFEKVLAVLKKF